MPRQSVYFWDKGYKMKKLEVGKSYNTRDGRQVRIYAVDGAGDEAIHGAVWSNLGTWRSTTWCADGSYFEYGSHDWDIVIPRNETETQAAGLKYLLRKLYEKFI